MDVDERVDAGPSNVNLQDKQNGHDLQPNGKGGDEDDVDEPGNTWPVYYTTEIKGIKPSHLSGSQDIIAVFNLSRTYDTFVRPYLNVNLPAKARVDSPSDQKGKDPSAAIEGKDDAHLVATIAKEKEGARGKSMKKHYSHMISDVPGQNKLAKDHYLRDLLLNPDSPDSARLVPFDTLALREAFSLELGVLPDFDASIWRAETLPEESKRRAKKKRKPDDATNLDSLTGLQPPVVALAKRRKMD